MSVALTRAKHITQKGFTIVELLIVIVVIAILAAITIVAYNGVQQRARDSQRSSDLASIEKGLKLWAVDTGKNFSEINAGGQTGSGTAIGWFDSAYSSSQSVKSLLVNAGFLSNGVVDPINTKVNAPSFAYMLAECTTGDFSTRVIMAQLENPPAKTLTQQLGVTCNSSSFNVYASTYGMNYARLIKVQ